MPASVSTLGRPGLLRAILATLALGFAASAVPAAEAAAPGAFTPPDDPAVPGLIASLRGCLRFLSADDQRTLTLRAGLDGRPPRLSAAVAAALQRSPAAETAAEVSAIRKLETQRRRGVCQAQSAATTPSKTATTPAKTTTTSTTPAKTTTTPSTATDPTGSTTGALGVVIPVLLVLAFGAGVYLEMKRRPRS